MNSGPGRLTARPQAELDKAWPPGLRPLPGALLLVPQTPEPEGLVVFLHGAGGSATSGLELWRHVADDHGLLVLLPGSARRTWDQILGGFGPDVTALDRNLGEVFARYRPARLAMAGFSDGGSYALSLGLANGELFDTVMAFSPGFLAPPARIGRPAVWVSHGTGDSVLPVDRCGRVVVAGLRREKYGVTYEEFDGGHVITPGLVDEAIRHWPSR